jgi:hypothetical protein
VIGGFTDSSLKRGQTFHHLVFPPLLYYDVSMDEVVEHVVVIPTSPRSSKRSPDAKVIAVFILLFLPGQIIRRGGGGIISIIWPSKFC